MAKHKLHSFEVKYRVESSMTHLKNSRAIKSLIVDVRQLQLYQATPDGILPRDKTCLSDSRRSQLDGQ